MHPTTEPVARKPSGGFAAPPPAVAGSPPPGLRREIFGLDEGDVVLTFPDNLSLESYEDLESFMQLFLRKAKRRAEREKDTGHDGEELL